jgi:branched-chain amino acid aminotransferase
MPKYCFLNGEILPASEASINVYDIGILRGYGVYDGIAVYNGKPFRFEDHMARLRRSAGSLNISVPYSDIEISDAISKLLVKNQQERAILRVILTGGPTLEGIRYEPNKSTFYIVMEDFPPFPQQFIENGGMLISHEFERYLPESKTLNYIEAVRMQEERHRVGAIELLYTSHGKVLEAATSNFFAFIGDALVTPKDMMLKGITRKVALELAESHYEIEERELTLEETLSSTEAFITSSFKEIVPIVRIDERTISSGKPGEKTKHLIELFSEYAKNY